MPNITWNNRQNEFEIKKKHSTHKHKHTYQHHHTKHQIIKTSVIVSNANEVNETKSEYESIIHFVSFSFSL